MHTLPTIKLGQRPPVPAGTIILKKPKSRAQRFLEFQPKITPFLAGTLSALAGGGLITAGKVFLGTGLATGILSRSERARKFAAEKILDPTSVGVGLGGIIEDPSSLVPDIPSDQTLTEKIKEVFLEAGLIGAGAAALAGGAFVAGRKIKERVAKIPTPSLPGRRAAATFAALPSQVVPTFQQIPGQVQAPVEKVVAPEKAAMPPINIKNTFNPKINIRFSKSHKFINQQILVR